MLCINDGMVVSHALEVLKKYHTREPFKLSSEKASRDFFELMHAKTCRDSGQEQFIVCALDAGLRLIKCEVLFVGGRSGVPAKPEAIIKFLLLNDAASVIFAHNHPGGSIKPSAGDWATTEGLMAALELVNIRVEDHIIIGESVVSMRNDHAQNWAAAQETAHEAVRHYGSF